MKLPFISRFLSVIVVAAAASPMLLAQSPQLPEDGRYWLRLYGIEQWEWDLDRDGDGRSNRQEYYEGTDPLDPGSRLRVDIAADGDELVVSWEGMVGSLYDFLGSTDLQGYSPLLAEPLPGDGSLAEVAMVPGSLRGFFSVLALEPQDRDGDGLSDREEAILGTNPLLPNTDGDRFADGIEVFETFTDPLVFDPAGGTISGRVFLDDDLSGDLAGAAPVAGAMVYLDLDFDGRLGGTDPRTTTGEDGRYTFFDLPPGLYEVRQLLNAGQTQTVPAKVTPEIPDGLADEVISYTHAAGGALDVPYGYTPLPNWPAQDGIVLGSRITEVDPEVLLTPFGNRLRFPPIGSYAPAHFLTLPAGASVEVRFDEVIFDGEGNDFTVGIPSQGSAINFEPADLFFGPDAANVVMVALDEVPRNTFLGIDLADFPGVPFVQYLRLESRTPGGPGEGGTDRGFGLGGFLASNVLPLSSSARRVTITGLEVFSDEDFARFFQDLPPTLLLSTTGAAARASSPYALQLVANDDLGLASRSLVVNGQALALSDDGLAEFTPPFAGEMVIDGSATDSGGQTVTERWTIYVADENGVLPFDPETLAEQQGLGTTRVQVFSPASGEVPTADAPVVASILAEAGETPVWSISYAPIDAIDPRDLATADPDYIELGSGTGNVYSSQLATFPTTSLEDGIYFIKIVAQPEAGGEAVFYGQVLGVGIDPATLSTQIAITSPAPSSTAALVEEVRGSITSSRPVETWQVEFAPRSEIELANIGGDDPAWRLIGSGSGAQQDAVLASLDTSMLANGAYILRVSAFNDLRLGRVEAVEFEVMSNAKLGRNRFEFADVELELAGLPVQVVRVYDSFEKETVGDFGHGWSLALANPDVVETVADTGTTLFGATAFRDGTRIYLNAPDGRRLAFTFHAELAEATLLGAIYRPTFVPDPGNPFTLEVPEGDAGFLSLRPDGEVRLNFIGLAWNPDLYILGTPDGDRYTYDQRRGLLGIEDPNGNRLEFSPSGITHSGGQQITFTRDAQGRIVTVSAPGGRTWTYTYSAAGDLESVTEPGGAITTFNYSEETAHFVTGITDPFGRMPVRYEYDDDGRLVAVIDEFGNREEQSWDPDARTGTITDPLGNVTALVYDDRGNVLQVTDPLGNITTFSYDDPRHPDTETEVTTPNTRRRYELDEMGNITATRFDDSFFAVIRSTYDEAGRPLTVQKIGGVQDEFVYDENGNVIDRAGRLNGSSAEQRTYTPQGQVASITKNGQTLSFTYDPISGKPKREEGPFGFFRTMSYSPTGDISAINDAVGGTITFAFDDAPLRTTITDTRGGVQVATVEANGDLTQRDQNGDVLRTTRDSRGEERDRTLPDGAPVDREFDAADNLLSITVPGPHTNTYSYDALNRRTSMTDAAGEATYTNYDAEGRVVDRTDRNGKKISFLYNEFGLVAAERWHAPDDSVIREFTYDYDRGNGRLRSVTDGSSTWELFGGFSDSQPSRARYDYDGQVRFEVIYDWVDYSDAPRRIRLTDGDDPTLDMEIRANLVGDRNYGIQANMDGLANVSARYVYDAMGRLTDIDRFDFFGSSDPFPAPVSRTLMVRDIAGDITSIRHERSDGTLAFPDASFSFTRDLEGRILSRIQPGNTASYSYDAMDQVTGVTHTAHSDESFTYDVAGNPAAGTTGPDNRLLSLGDLTFTYDAEGNVITRSDASSGEVLTYTYDHRNQLSSVSTQTGTVAEYAYDYIGRPMFRIEDGVKTWIVYDRDAPAGEFLDGTTTYSRVLLYDLGEIERHLGEWTPAGGFRWFLTDQIGSVHGHVAADGTPADWIDYHTSGLPRTPAPNNFGPRRFAGRHWNASARLYENRLRHYDPSTARFQQQDPIRYDSGDFNLYRYAENNPVSKTDPDGTSALNEYGQLLKRVSSCAKKVKPVGECVDAMLTAAAKAVAGIQSSVDVNCATKSSSGLLKGCAK